MSLTLSGRWSADQANAWYVELPYLIGVNYTPSTAINQLEMWQAETFDLATIERELQWAQQIGINTLRVFLHDLLFDQDAEGFMQRIDQFLTVAERYGHRVMLVIFDNVWNPEAQLGRQPEPVRNVHNSGWVQSPTQDILADIDQHDRLKPYFQTVMQRFANDPRVLIWDIFNEPGQPNVGSYYDVEIENKDEVTAVLLQKAFAWAREVNPSQPITAGGFSLDWARHWRIDPPLPLLNEIMFANSDVISFHAYQSPEDMNLVIEPLKAYNRPILCTEWMARVVDCRIQNVLPVLKEHNVGSYMWGFVAGKTQTNCSWSSWVEDDPQVPEPWFHDIVYPDGRPYDEAEIACLKKIAHDG